MTFHFLQILSFDLTGYDYCMQTNNEPEYGNDVPVLHYLVFFFIVQPVYREICHDQRILRRHCVRQVLWRRSECVLGGKSCLMTKLQQPAI